MIRNTFKTKNELSKVINFVYDMAERNKNPDALILLSLINYELELISEGNFTKYLQKTKEEIVKIIEDMQLTLKLCEEDIVNLYEAKQFLEKIKEE